MNRREREPVEKSVKSSETAVLDKYECFNWPPDTGAATGGATDYHLVQCAKSPDSAKHPNLRLVIVDRWRRVVIFSKNATTYLLHKCRSRVRNPIQ